MVLSFPNPKFNKDRGGNLSIDISIMQKKLRLRRGTLVLMDEELLNAFYEIGNIYLFINYCQALSISKSLHLSLSLRDRDRADTTNTLHHTTPPTSP